jgi:hypothetical protein
VSAIIAVRIATILAANEVVAESRRRAFLDARKKQHKGNKSLPARHSSSHGYNFFNVMRHDKARPAGSRNRMKR